MEIDYRINAPISAEQFIGLLQTSGLAERRPVEDHECMEGMVSNSNLTVTAWDGEALVGIARSMTDFHYACYLSDLAVAETHQSSGVGRKLMAITQEQLGPKCRLIAIAAPAADFYYAHLGFTNNPRCWVLERDKPIHPRTGITP